MKFQKATKNRGFIELFRKNKMKLFHIDEYKTSSICPDCDNEISKNIKKRPSSRPWKNGKREKVHGLLGCRNQNCLKQNCEWKFWNRDMLSVRNMQRIVDNVLQYGERPESLSRKKK